MLPVFQWALRLIEEGGGEVALGKVGKDDDDGLAGELVQVGQAHGRGRGGSARYPDEKPLFPAQPPGELDRLVSFHLFDPVDEGEVEGVGDEARADPLDLVRTGL